MALNKSYCLLNGLICAPNKVFMEIKNGSFYKEVKLIFAIGMLVTFWKTFLINTATGPMFFNEILYDLLTFLNIPQTRWCFMYLLYFLFIYCLFKYFTKGITFKPFALTLMSISGIGTVMQALFYFLSFILPKFALTIAAYAILLWVIMLSLLAVKSFLKASLRKIALYFFLIALPFVFFSGFVVLAPYLAWLDLVAG